jgi:hypothetical protein
MQCWRTQACVAQLDPRCVPPRATSPTTTAKRDAVSACAETLRERPCTPAYPRRQHALFSSTTAQPRMVLQTSHGPVSGVSRIASPRNLRRRCFSHTYHCTCRREMTLCAATFGRSLRERERLWSITNASAMMLSTVSVVVEHARQHGKLGCGWW